MWKRNVITIVAVLSLLSWHRPIARAEPPATQPVALYDPDPNHLWNRLHTILRVRTGSRGQPFGQDTLDVLLWPNTKHLLEADSHQNTIDVLDEFLRNHGERLITDSLKRAILQHDLWAVFDFAAQRRTDHQNERAELESRLAQVIQRLALSQKQIGDLPDVYHSVVDAARFSDAFDPANPTTPFLPRDMFDPSGPWINIAARDDSSVAPVHAEATSHRSIFEVYLRHPDGQQAGLDYLEKLSKTPPYNPDVAQFPIGTQLALVRRAILIDDQQMLTPTKLIESIQLRVFRRIDPDPNSPDPALFEFQLHNAQAFVEFQLRRADLFADPAGALHAFKPGDQEATTFGGENIDLFEDTRPNGGQPRYTQGVLGSGCFDCHYKPGVQSMHSFTRSNPYPSPGIVAADRKVEVGLAVGAKEKRADWKLLLQIMGRTDAR